MALRKSIGRAIKHVLLERPAAKKSIAELADGLARSGAAIGRRLAAAEDTAKHRQVLCHIIGMERWGQRRLQVALGEPPIRDEHDGYCPAATLSLPELAGEFAATRQATVALARRIEQEGATRSVVHNQFGHLTPRAWLLYLASHASIELRLARL